MWGRRSRDTTASSVKSDSKSLENLIKEYLKKTEELEQKEGKILLQVERMHSAVAALQEQKNQRSRSRSVHDDSDEVDRETEKIKEETLRIQKEIEEKIDENKRLEDKLERRRRGREREDSVTNNFVRAILKERERKRESIEDDKYTNFSRGLKYLKPSAPLESERRTIVRESFGNEGNDSIRMFNEKIKQLKKIQNQLKKELEKDSKVSRSRQEKLNEKIEMLEWEAEINRQLIQYRDKN